ILIQDVAQQLFVTEKYLCSTFKKQTGFTLKQYISHCRIQKARNVLHSETATPKEAFLQSGYNDYPTFLRMFKKIVGKTPTEFKKCYAQERSAYPKEILEKMTDDLPEEEMP
ncbi:MAG: AraC family transcriptional regulator, partial [Clostridia bacterium]|nr:AraC family transcriptional regulator [Clostridia bacterium]